MKTHRDFLHIIGTTHATSPTYRDLRWNGYYHRTYQRIVHALLKGIRSRDVIFDLGTSHGHWLPFFKREGFKTILGVEIDAERAKLAQAAGYDAVLNEDAVKLSQASESVDVVISTDVFVHILQMEDKKAVLKEAERILKNGGTLIINHIMARAFGYEKYTIKDYLSYLTLAEFLHLFEGTKLKITDIKPTYFNFNIDRSFFQKALLATTTLPVPFGIAARMWLDRFFAYRLPTEATDVIYIKATKTA
jgi:ubiquinone/menaquinone biosynthesis C-methylase UbiE